MKLRTPLLPILVLAAMSGCAAPQNVTKLSSDTYAIARTDKGGSMDDIGSTKSAMMHEANDFAAKQGKVASTVAMKETPMSVQGFTALEYQFKLVDKDAMPRPPASSARVDGARAATYTSPAVIAPAAQAPNVDNLYAELLKLDELRKRGILTEDEFSREKKKILDSN